MTVFSTFDVEMMNRAIKLAYQGRFTTAPNPNVGCVITSNGTIVGEGYHAKAGEPHAEVHAMLQAGDKAQGATAYVTLEPCSHYGRTPPCAEGLIKAGVQRVVCAMGDPNPLVSGRGFEMLRQAGIQVDVGLLEEQAEALNPGFIKKMKTGMPFVQLKMAATLDGQTALSNGKSQWITSEHARRDVQKYRALSGAILSTSKTVIEDNASLAVRWNDLPQSTKDKYEEGQLRQPIRVILDRQHLLSPTLRLFDETRSKVLSVAEKNADIQVETNSGQQLNIQQTLKALAEKHQVNHVWVEAGATLAGSMIKSGLVDEIILYLAPKIIGSDGRGVFSTLGLSEMEEIIELDINEVIKVGDDIKVIARPKRKK